MDTAEHIKHLAREGRLLADAAEEAGCDAEVRPCPGWEVRHLLRHTGMVHRWATAFVAEGLTSYRPGGGEPDLDGPALLDWYREGHERLVTALTGAPDALECWTFLPAPSPVAFWARRQAHETTVHRVDAESALGLVAGRSAVGAELAADGIDELLRGFHGRAGSRVRTDRPGTLRVRTTDTGDVWRVALSAEPPRTERTAGGAPEAVAVAVAVAVAGGASDGPSDAVAGGPAECELSGTAEALYLSLWNRLPAGTPAVTVTGDDRLARLWRETSAVTW
ncbi:maleylpyruvate isomerase family mycothiol-dependent enzyme [Streptomyces fradiae]|uniref:maleylpyruvate isomerase family mycothiol-dependent enzyme n=1 Tax=Streptomyces fradiae TaxID=1906 RepID=UPI0036FFBBC9